MEREFIWIKWSKGKEEKEGGSKESTRLVGEGKPERKEVKRLEKQKIL